MNYNNSYLCLNYLNCPLNPKPNIMNKIIITLLLLLTLDHAFAQVNNSQLFDNITVNPSDSGKFSIAVNNFNYLRNTEYFNKIELGRTLFGTQLHPTIGYQPTANIKLNAGVFLRSDFGATPSINQILPTFSVKISNQKQTRHFIFGTLEGALAHQLIEPLFDINSAILNRIENGAQFKINNNKVFFDSWINWQKFISQGSPYKEQFTTGFNFTPTILSTKSGFEILPTLQATAFHRGGQIDSDSSNMVMVFNGALGFTLKKSWQKTFVKQISASVYGTFYRENSNSGYLPYKNGMGVYPTIFVSTKWLDVMVNYWQANKFIAPVGSSIYQSVAQYGGFTEKARKLLILRLMYNHKLVDDLFLGARVEPIFDLKNKQTDYSYSLYLTYNLKHTFTRK